jgi:hypothetical protein
MTPWWLCAKETEGKNCSAFFGVHDLLNWQNDWHFSLVIRDVQGILEVIYKPCVKKLQ